MAATETTPTENDGQKSPVTGLSNDLIAQTESPNTGTEDPKVAVKVPEGLVGSTTNEDAQAVIGINQATGALGHLGGHDLRFKHHVGVYGQSDQEGIIGLTTSPTGTGVFGSHTVGAEGGFGVRGESNNGIAVQGQNFGSGLAGKFIGNVDVTGTVSCADCTVPQEDVAEDFDILGQEIVEPGTVMVISGQGALQPCTFAYDKKVTGVISGAGSFKPGITLGRRASNGKRLPIALVGKVYCKVDAQHAAIEVGDLLTTSPTVGHAMKADDPYRSFGSVIGKALASLESGQGVIPILVTLQ